jgi:hypothetical protein
MAFNCYFGGIDHGSYTCPGELTGRANLKKQKAFFRYTQHRKTMRVKGQN